MASHYSLRQKLWAPLVVCWLALLALTLFNAFEARTKAYDARRQALSDVIQMADALIAGIKADVQAGKLTDDAGKAEALARVGALRYSNGAGYVTIVGTDSVVLNNPASTASSALLIATPQRVPPPRQPRPQMSSVNSRAAASCGAKLP